MKQLASTLARLSLLVLIALCISVLADAQTVRLPYFNGFENPGDSAGWTFKKRPRTCAFEIGTANHCLGSRSLYVSPDAGATATYSTSSSGYVTLAYKSFTLPQGTYNLAFDYALGGDGQNQDMMVAWVPTSTTLNAASLGSAYPAAITLNAFTDNTNQSVFGKAAWKHVVGTINVPAGGGAYNLCFAFRCNSTSVIEPGACVDNIQIDTVKTSTDCTYPPTNITVVKDPQQGVLISWAGNATEYEVIAASASDPMDNSFCVHTGITGTNDTMQYNELGEGQYFFYVRAICDSDTSIYGEISNVLIYDVSSHCIDFITFNAPGTQCTYGTYTNPYANNGAIDNGSAQMSSRHTIHTDLNETDPRTGNGLNTVPQGEVMSVRLGNWDTGSEGEAITYTYNVPAGSNLILMMKYAVVFEEPGHAEPPEFLLEIMNQNNVLLDATCTKANFRCDGTLTQGWHNVGGIWWKQWTTIGVNLSNYAGQTVKIRLTTKDCNWGGHYGYAYYTLNCSNAEFTGLSCGETESTEIKAPDGFNYQWTNNCTNQVISTAQSIPISGTDTCSYTCRCSYKEQPSCSFSLTAYTIPRLPMAKFTYRFSYSNCQTHITFTNTSEIYVLQNGDTTWMPNERLTSQTWTVTSRHPGRPYHNRVSQGTNLSPVDVPVEGDTLIVRLQAVANGCDDDTTMVIYVPALQESHGVTDRYVCEGDPVTFNGEVYRFISADTVQITGTDGTVRYLNGQKSIQVIDTLKSWCGCDSILELNLSAMIPDTINIDTTICSDQTFCIKVYDVNNRLVLDTCPHATGHYDLYVPSSLGSCDSLYYSLELHVLNTLKVAVDLQNMEICANDSQFYATYSVPFGALLGYMIEYDDAAKKQGFEDSRDTVFFDSVPNIVFNIPKKGWVSGSHHPDDSTYVRPDSYVASITFFNENRDCGDVVTRVPFTVQYPKDVITQRWNDLLAVRNTEYNGGFDFVEYRWYRNGQPIVSHVATMSQLYHEGEDLTPGDEYQVDLKRVGEPYYVRSCVFTVEHYDETLPEMQSSTITLGAMDEPLQTRVPMRANARLYDINGEEIGFYHFEEGDNSFPAPDHAGIYVMVYIYENGTTEAVKFIVE